MRPTLLSGILLFLACLHGPLHAASPTGDVAIDGLVVHLPPGGWQRIEHDPGRVMFARGTADNRTTLAYSLHSIEPLPDDEAFLRFAEAQQVESLKLLEKVSVHYHSVQRQGVPCLVYDGIYRDGADPASPYRVFRGQLCRHPESTTILVRMELARRSATEAAAYQVDFSELPEQAFEAVRFSGLPGTGGPPR